MVYIYGLPAELVAGGTDVNVAPGLGAIVATGFAPGIAAGAAVTAGLGGIVLTGHAPSVTAGSGASVAPGAGSVVLAGSVPTVTATSGGTSVTVAPGVGSALVTGFAPTVGIVPWTPGPITSLHYAPNANLVGGVYVPAADGFNLADISGAASDLDLLPDGVLGLVYLGATSGADPAFIAQVTPYLSHPKLWGFYIQDEPQPGVVDPANLAAECDWIHANAPGIKCYLAVENEGTPHAPSFSFNQANTHADYFGLAAYPVRDQFSGGIDLSIIEGYVDAAIAAGIPRSAIIPQYQVFGGGGYSSWTLPTSDQLQATLNAWALVVPTPAFDVAYSWGSQLGDTALVDSPLLQDVMRLHNGYVPPAVAPPGGSGDSQLPKWRKKKRKPVARALKSLSDLSEVTAVYEPLAEPVQPSAPQIEAPAFGAVLRQLDAERVVRDRIQAENAAVTARRQAETDAIAAARRAADDAAREQAEREAEAAHQAAFAAARDARLRAMVESWNVLIQRKLDEDEEDVEQLVLGAW